MKVLYDHQIFVQGTGGASRYYSEVINYLDKDPDVDVELSLMYSGNIYLTGSEFGKGRYQIPANSSDIRQFLPGINFKGKGRLFNVYSRFQKQVDILGENQLKSIEAIQKGEFDVFHPTYYDPYFLDYIGSKPFVLTVLDMNHEVYPEYFQGEDMLSMARNKRKLAESATKIIAISEKTKEDLVKILGISPQKVDVVYLANSLDPKLATQSDYKFPEKYILYVGHRWIYKNFYLFARAASRLMQKDPQLNLVCVGGGAFSNIEQGYFQVLGISDRVTRVDADDPTLAKAYTKAQLFVYPSLYEGFGIPILEAYACGCPVACSDVSCFPEIAGDAAAYFQPKDMESMVAALDKAMHDNEFRSQLIKNGEKRAELFSWSQTAAQTKVVYQSITR